MKFGKIKMETFLFIYLLSIVGLVVYYLISQGLIGKKKQR